MASEEDALTRQIKIALQHLATLEEHARGSADLRPAVDEALADLGVVLEELHVAQEEARAQGEELKAHTEELERGQAALEAERQRYRELFEFAPDGYLVTNLEGVIQEANAAAGALLGVQADYLKGLPLAVFVPGDGKQALYVLLRHVQETRETAVDWQLTLQPRGGTAVPVSVTVGVAGSGARRPAGLRWLLRDITVRHRTEAQLRDRTGQLRQLTRALTLAEERERQRLALVLHDEFQQLLVGMRLLLSSLETAEDPKAREIGREVRDLAARCLQVSRDLTEELSPPGLHSGGLLPALEWLVRWMAETHHFTVRLESDSLSAKEGGTEATVLLFRAVRELVLNTVKHAQVDTARVEVARDGGGMQVVVSDAGVGFEPTHLRLMGGTVGGTGLLTIRERLEYLGGSLAIESTPGHGSRFILRLPTQPSGSSPTSG